MSTSLALIICTPPLIKRSQWHLTQSLFTFRDSFQPATAVFYDPQALFSSETINQYGIIHLLANYNVQWYESQAQLNNLHGTTERKGDFYGRLHSYRQPKLTAELKLDTRTQLPDTDKETFEAVWTRKPVALRGLELRAKERQGDPVPLHAPITRAIQEQFIPVLLLPYDSDFPYVPRAYRRLRQSIALFP